VVHSGGYGAPPQPQYNQYPSSAAGSQFPQQGAYNQAPYPNDPNNPYGQAQQQPGYGPTDPAQQQEGDRGLLGAVAGGIAGRYAGKQAGHGLIGTLAGGFLGSKLEDKYKHNHHGKRW
jgi:hypothetical protein